MRIIDREEVARRLTYEVCIPIVREAMTAFSNGETRQLLRSIIPLAEGRMFGIMPGALGDQQVELRLLDGKSITPYRTLRLWIEVLSPSSAR